MLKEEYKKKQEGENQVKTIPGKVCEKDENGNLGDCEKVELPLDEIIDEITKNSSSC